MPMSIEGDGWRGWLRGAAKLLLYATVTGIVTLILAYALSAGQNRDAINLLRDVRNSSRATACVLALPVTEQGRDPALVGECFAANGIAPPDLGMKP